MVPEDSNWRQGTTENRGVSLSRYSSSLKNKMLKMFQDHNTGGQGQPMSETEDCQLGEFSHGMYMPHISHKCRLRIMINAVV